MTIIGDKVLRQTLVDLLNRHRGEIRHLLAKRLTTRTVPEMTFVYDDSVEYGARMEKLLHDIVEEDKIRHGNLQDNEN